VPIGARDAHLRAAIVAAFALVSSCTGGGAPRLSLAVIAAATLVTAGFFLLVVGKGLMAQRLPVKTGRLGLLGVHAVVAERLGPQGLVKIGDEIWTAVSNAPVEAGAEVEITGVDGLTLRVRPLAKEA